MVKEISFEISQQKKIAKDIFCMNLVHHERLDINPGQFINISIPGKYLRRPISISEYDKNSITIVYKDVGCGTNWLSKQKAGTKINALAPLGNGFTTLDKYKLLIGGGIGAPPLVQACKVLNKNGIRPTVILGFLNKDDAYYIDKFESMANVFICTDDGSLGEKGLVTDLMIKHKLCNIPYLTCGPLPMEKAIFKLSNAQGQISLEARMGCGFGACMGCSIETKLGPQRICKEGPVFRSEVLKW